MDGSRIRILDLDPPNCWQEYVKGGVEGLVVSIPASQTARAGFESRPRRKLKGVVKVGLLLHMPAHHPSTFTGQLIISCLFVY